MTFDAWEVGIQGNSGSLMHWGIPGMKHGRNRYQNPDGTWTDEGLARRRKREGFGDSKEERKVAKLEKRIARKEAAKERKAARTEKRRLRSVKGLTDDELQQKINRLKMEQEYKELSKSPIVKTGEQIIKSYIDAKEKKTKLEMDKANLIIRDRESKAKLLQAKAANTTAKSDLIDNIFSGKGKKKAKKELIEAKAKNQVRGAIRKSISNIISKEGQRFVNDMDDHSITMRAGRRIKKGFKNAGTKYQQEVADMIKKSQYNQAGIKRPKGTNSYMTAGAHPNTHPTSGKKIKGSKGWKKK